MAFTNVSSAAAAPRSALLGGGTRRNLLARRGCCRLGASSWIAATPRRPSGCRISAIHLACFAAEALAIAVGFARRVSTPWARSATFVENSPDRALERVAGLHPEASDGRASAAQVPDRVQSCLGEGRQAVLKMILHRHFHHAQPGRRLPAPGLWAAFSRVKWYRGVWKCRCARVSLGCHRPAR